MASNVYAKNEGMNLQYLQKNEVSLGSFYKKMRITLVFEQLFIFIILGFRRNESLSTQQKKTFSHRSKER